MHIHSMTDQEFCEEIAEIVQLNENIPDYVRQVLAESAERIGDFRRAMDEIEETINNIRGVLYR